MKDAGQIRKFLLAQGMPNTLNIAVKENGAVVEFLDVDKTVQAQCAELMKSYQEPSEKAEYEKQRAGAYPAAQEWLEILTEQIVFSTAPENQTDRMRALVAKINEVQEKFPKP